MNSRHFLLLALLALLSLPLSVQAEATGKQVHYQAGEVEMHGYLAWDESLEGKRPGVLVVHEWWGHNDYARKRAAMLAELGYTALAVDMYGDGKTAEHPDDAGQFAGAVMNNMETAKARFQAALSILKQHETVDPEKTAAIGYCFGGGVVLHMARMGLDLDAVASFHGSLGSKTPAQTGAVRGRVVAYNGAADPFVSAAAIQAFKNEMEAAGVDYEFINYAGVQHSFTNPGADAVGAKFGLPLQYNELADASSWTHMQLLFKDTFADKKQPDPE